MESNRDNQNVEYDYGDILRQLQGGAIPIQIDQPELSSDTFCMSESLQRQFATEDVNIAH